MRGCAKILGVNRRSAHRALLFAFAALVAGVLAALIAVTGDGGLPRTVPWWLVCVAVCLALPQGAWSAPGALLRLSAVGALFVTAMLFVGGQAAIGSAAILVPVVAGLWVTLALMLARRLRGQRATGLALVAAPLLMIGTTVPVLLGAGRGGDVRLDLAAGSAAVAAHLGPVFLLGGSALLVGTVAALVARLRTTISARTARSLAFVLGGAALVLVAAAGVLSSGTVAPTRHLGFAGLAVGVAALVLLTRGLTQLGRAREVYPSGSVLAAVAVGFVFAGALLPPDSVVAAVGGLLVLVVLAALLGAVAGLCGAAALLRSPSPVHLPAGPEVLTSRLEQLARIRRHGWDASPQLAGLRAQLTHPVRTVQHSVLRMRHSHT